MAYLKEENGKLVVWRRTKGVPGGHCGIERDWFLAKHQIEVRICIPPELRGKHFRLVLEEVKNTKKLLQWITNLKKDKKEKKEIKKSIKIAENFVKNDKNRK